MTGGGGGYGSPLERKPESVRDDVRAGYVSAQAARTIYGVALAGSELQIDAKETARLRRELGRGAAK